MDEYARHAGNLGDQRGERRPGDAPLEPENEDGRQNDVDAYGKQGGAHGLLRVARVPHHVVEIEKDVPEFGYRLKVKAGLTGYAQIYGKYNTSAYDKLKLDLMYIQNYSILLDLRLILMTVKIMFIKDSTEGFEEIKPSEKKD